MEYLLKIELLSDACICSGTSSGASIDTDVYTNEFGFPYIPSKRIKGLLREAFEEYEYMFDKDIGFNKLFGTENDIEGSLKISNAELEEFFNEKESIISDIKYHHINPSYIKDIYVSNRTQTSIDEETGSSLEKSLRTTNVVNKGLVFISKLNGLDEREIDDFKLAIKLVKHMGLHRNRGLGLVKLTIEEAKELNTIKIDDDFDYIELHISNESDLMITSNTKDKTLPYISGSCILGYFANKYAEIKGIEKDEINEEFNDMFLNSNLIFTNGYISDDEFNEYVPVPSFIKREKNKQKFGNKIITKYVNMFTPLDEVKVGDLSGKFIKKADLLNKNGLPLNNLHIIEPEFEYNYHTALEDGVVRKDNGFYQYFAIAANQHFVSKIYGKKEYIKKLFDVVNMEYAYFGKCKNSQYARCKINAISRKNDFVDHGDLLVFVSPSNICNANNVSVLDINGVCENLSIKQDGDYNLKYSSFGGFNNLWKLPKKQVTSIQMESFIEGNINGTNQFIGEDNNIGFGEVLVLDKKTLCQVNNDKTTDIVDSDLSYSSKWFTKGKYYRLNRTIEVMNNALDYVNNNPKFAEEFKSTQVEKIFTMLEEQPSYSTFNSNINEIADTQDKFKKLALEFISKETNENIYKLFYKTALTVIKYDIRLKEDK